jgi:hypothetical protein
MADELTDTQIERLCDIGEYDPITLTGDKRRDLERLLSGGYVEPTKVRPSPALKFTAKAIAFLGERGVGLNEA